jgi:hypothetical protein
MKRNGQQELKRLTDGEESNAFTSLAWTRPTASAKKITRSIWKGFQPDCSVWSFPLPNHRRQWENARNKRHRKDGEVPFGTSLGSIPKHICGFNMSRNFTFFLKSTTIFVYFSHVIHEWKLLFFLTFM